MSKKNSNAASKISSWAFVKTGARDVTEQDANGQDITVHQLIGFFFDLETKQPMPVENKLIQITTRDMLFKKGMQIIVGKRAQAIAAKVPGAQGSKPKPGNRSVVTQAKSPSTYLTKKEAKKQQAFQKRKGLPLANPQIPSGAVAGDKIIDYTATISKPPFTRGQGVMLVDDYAVLVKTKKLKPSVKAKAKKEEKKAKRAAMTEEEKATLKAKKQKAAAKKAAAEKLKGKSKKEREEALAKKRSRKARQRGIARHEEKLGRKMTEEERADYIKKQKAHAKSKAEGGKKKPAEAAAEKPARKPREKKPKAQPAPGYTTGPSGWAPMPRPPERISDTGIPLLQLVTAPPMYEESSYGHPVISGGSRWTGEQWETNPAHEGGKPKAHTKPKGHKPKAH